MLVCQVAMFSPICIFMPLKECVTINKQILKAHQYHLNYMPSDAKHSIFMSKKRGGIGIRSFTREYIGALLQNIEVYISNDNSLPVHALCTSINEATKQKLWNLYQESRILSGLNAINRIRHFHISGKKTILYQDNFQSPYLESVSFDHAHIMNHAISTTCALGFIL